MLTTYAAHGYGELGTESAAIEYKALREKSTSRHAIESRKQAELLEREAAAKKEAAEKAWHKRLEEKTRYTDEQRSWWDEQARQSLQRDNSLAKDGSTHLSAATLDRQRKEAYKEHLGNYEDLQMKLKKVEDMDKDMAHRGQVAREKSWQEQQRQARQLDAEFGKGLEKRKDLAAKDELSRQTIEQAAHQAKLNGVKARLGEGSRIQENKAREQNEAMHEEQRQKAQEIARGRFKQDEALRQERKDAKSQKKKAIHNANMTLHQQQEADRLAEEKAKRLKEKREKKEFQERLRKQAADKALADEHAKHVEEEAKAQNKMIDAQRALKQAEKWSGHMQAADQELHSTMEQVNLDKSVYHPHTEYERHQWSLFGSAKDPKEEANKLGFLGSALNLNNKDL